MTAKQWKSKITEACKASGTYKPQFVAAIDTLADILSKRDGAQELFESTGCKYVIPHTNKNGSTNLEQSPIIRLINDLNRDALTYWRDLGLTPKGLKAIDEKAMKAGKESAVEKLLDVLGG